MRSDVPGGAEGLLVPPAGVAEAGGARARVLIEHLRAQIRALEQVPVSLAIPPAPGAAPPHPACSFALIWNAHPWRAPFGRLRMTPLGPLHKLWEGGLHEIKPDASGDRPAALAFALAVIAQQAAQVERRGLVLWCLTNKAAREWGRPYGPGLIASGLDPARLLIVHGTERRRRGLGSGRRAEERALIAALAGIEIKTPLMARRLSLAAQVARTPCLLLSDHRTRKPPRHHHDLAHRRAKKRIRLLRRDGTRERLLGSSPLSVAGAKRRGRALSWSSVMSRVRFRLSPASSDRAAEAGESIERRRAFSG